MKTILISAIFWLCASTIFSQAPCDIAQTGLGVSPSTIGVGQTADFTFSIFNAGTNTGCTIPANTVRAVLSLPSDINGAPRFYQFNSVVSPAGGVGAYFTYTYDAANNVVIGTNQNPIPNGLGEQNVRIRVTGIEVTSSSGAFSNLNLQQGGGVSNNTGNDASSAPLVVTTILPIKLGAFSASNKNCQNTINWTSLQEEKLKSFEIEASQDGRTFKQIGTVPASGNSNLARKYSYTDASPVNGITHYRLKMIDLDGNFAYSGITKATSKCDGQSISIYPNPILTKQQQLTVVASGYNGKINGDLMSLTGQVLKTYSLVNGTNKLTVDHLPQGTYLLRLTNVQGGDVNTYKIVVLK